VNNTSQGEALAKDLLCAILSACAILQPKLCQGRSPWQRFAIQDSKMFAIQDGKMFAIQDSKMLAIQDSKSLQPH
jgi:hypothetical protein